MASVGYWRALDLSSAHKWLRVGFAGLVGVCLLPAAAHAADVDAVADGEDATATDETPLKSGMRWHVNGNWRLVGDNVTPIEVDAPDAQRLSPNEAGEHRLRLGGDVRYALETGFVRALAAEVQADFRQSNYTVDTPEGYLARKAFVEATTLAGQFSAGRMTQHWGLGLVAQDGVDDPMQFGVKRGGGIVDRVQYAILPAALFQGGDPVKAFPLALAVAYDKVIQDDNARTSSDNAHHWLAALLYRSTALDAGLYGVKRDQTDNMGLGLHVLMADAFARYSAFLPQGGKLTIAAEAAYIGGTTTWLRTINQPDHLDVAQWGGVLRIEGERGPLQVRLEGGIASGDDRPFDSTLHNFQFASDYHVGIVLFSQYMRLQSRNTMANLGDPRFTNGAPAGVERLDTHGAVTQAMYLNPVIRLALPKTRSGAKFALLWGMVAARAPVAVADPFRTYLNGGVPTGPRGAKNQTDLGAEFDSGLTVEQPFGFGLSAFLRADVGVLLPGHAYDAADGTSAPAVAATQVQLALRGAW